jgi:hypothetical protein
MRQLRPWDTRELLNAAVVFNADDADSSQCSSGSNMVEDNITGPWVQGEQKIYGAGSGAGSLTMGSRGSLEAPPSGAGSATTVLHSSVPVEREGSNSS